MVEKTAMMYKKCQAGVQKMHTCLSICDSSRTCRHMARYLLKKQLDYMGNQCGLISIAKKF